MLDGARAFHVNVNCRDLERSQRFYEALGLHAGAHTAPDAVQPGGAFGLDEAMWDAWILVGPQGFDGTALDLLEWKAPPPAGAPPANLYTQGFQRVGVLVPDLDAAMSAVRAHGGDVWSEPVRHSTGATEVRIVMANDPDGVIVELVEAGGPALMFAGVVCTDLERSVSWYRALGYGDVARFTSDNADSGHLRIDGASSFEEVLLTAPGGGLSLLLVGFTAPRVEIAPPRPANAVGIWRLALLVANIDAACRGLAARGVDAMSPPVSMAMGAGLPELRFVCFRGPDAEVIELIEQPS